MNLLKDGLFRVETGQGLERMNLPQLFAALGKDEVQHFTGIQRHQEGAFHVFLSQLAAAILAHQNGAEPAQCEDFWHDRLLALAGDAADHAWTLVVDDLSRPAFMQPPLPRTDWKQLEQKASTPDELDLLNTSKNHDLKRARAQVAEADEWIYALISLQTMSGYMGSGHYGIARMNGGYGSRSIVEVVRSFTPGARWRDTVLWLREYRQEVLGRDFGYDPQGLVLVWTEPWDGQTSLPLSKLDPFFVEICRRMRLKGDGAIASAWGLNSRGRRIDAEQLNGVVGDAWLPVDLGDPKNGKSPGAKALTVSEKGFTADLLRRLIFAQELQLTCMQKAPKDWTGSVWLVASVLVRGMGTTDGFHEKQILIPPQAQKRVFGPATNSNSLALLAKTAIEYTGKMQKSVLKPAIFSYLEGGPKKDRIDLSRDTIKDWWGRFARDFEAQWSREYFPWLWKIPDQFDHQAESEGWVLKLRDIALEVLDEAERSAPLRAGLKYRARVEARQVFSDYLKRNFPFLKGVGP